MDNILVYIKKLYEIINEKIEFGKVALKTNKKTA